jgi:hypothetical protein
MAKPKWHVIEIASFKFKQSMRDNNLYLSNAAGGPGN